ncbi:Piwi domain-containing protein, partial [Chytridium lagenaria]
FVKRSEDGDRKGNLKAGTVVDTGIVHPFEYDFFLNSHQGLQGTSRSSHYHVIYDENKMSPDDLQQFTNEMCYVFARA